MSQTLRCALRSLCTPLKRDVLKLAPPLSSVLNTRFLYAKATLGLDGFAEQSKQIHQQMENIAGKFREKMTTYSSEDSQNMIFTEDLKNMVYMAESDADVELVVKMTKKFNSQNKELRFGNFVFGPVIMRMFYTHNKADLALECFKAPEFDGIFDQLITYQILLDLLYENGKYQEILDTFEVIKGRQLEGTKYPRNSVVLVMAACYKMNSKESVEYALKFWNELRGAGHFPMRRATTFCAGLALNQGMPEAALEIISNVRNPNYVTIRNIKARALSEIGRLDDVITILKSVISDDRPGEVAHTFNRDVLEAIKAKVLEADNPEISAEFNRLEKLFEKEGHITNETLDQHLCSEIQKPPVMNNRQGNRFNRFQQSDRRPSPGFKRPSYRPGLKDLI
ncbi:pentatricopeptide repeat-containing protein 2, mitochondrial [Tribolium castaneum]|uniref:Pentatricopeptide repeat-containing protein 2, mitochondrial-like Protein n=1 Tax=Tribolium castaneum TaxID=7070 RepID=D6WRX9_TRICA|nr:PREDICTED: pentatricopeptide repeat-containing protein 2, mitochondrial [Tribolium castaneum]EFA06421.2 Pentatricopeptide repeat-containing protein 2, mitochondrial-like Protein [Tribolium castaneum]|eukprot:XP_966911.1 PREDICTED: pentatricopeptide repeat-containing protein 2, mitochondrial [Tribolium castaneum]